MAIEDGMLNKNLSDYIKEKLGMGYHINIIRGVLVKWGYNLKDIDEAIISLQGQKSTEARREHNLLNLFFRPGRFFGDLNNYNIKKSLSYFLYSFLIFFLIRTIVISVNAVFEKETIVNTFMSILANAAVVLLFLVALFFFFVVLMLIYFTLFNYILKIRINFSLLFAILLFSLVPYILISSINGFGVYNVVTVINVSVGFLNINVFLLWSLFLFSFGISKNLGIDFKKSALFIFIPFILFLGVAVLVFYGIIRLNLLWFVFERF